MVKFSDVLALCLLLIGAGCDNQSNTPQDARPASDLSQQLPGFIVRDITGPFMGQTHCYCCQYGYRPVVIVFAREVDDEVQNLVKKIDVQVDENKDKRLAAFMVVLTDDKDAFEPRLKALAKAAGIAHTPLTIIEAAAPPREYKIADEALVTVMMLVDKEVLVNRSFVTGELDKIAIDALVAETGKILK